jgi:glycosyltransferase involved in cell wall biosynthesis
VPSDFENFGMIVTESLSVGSPVIASLGTPWQELETCHCGRWVDNSVKTLAETIESQLALPLNQINQMGENGKALVAKKYKADKVAAMMSSLYDWVQDGGILPPFVQM